MSANQNWSGSTTSEFKSFTMDESSQSSCVGDESTIKSEASSREYLSLDCDSDGTSHFEYNAEAVNKTVEETEVDTTSVSDGSFALDDASSSESSSEGTPPAQAKLEKRDKLYYYPRRSRPLPPPILPQIDLDHPPVSSRINFIPKLNDSMSSEERIKLITEAIQNVRNKHATVKSEMDRFVRRRRRGLKRLSGKP